MVTLGVASLFPDVMDKTLAYGFHLSPSGRHYAHNMVSLLLSSFIVMIIAGKAAGYAWFMGYLGHLIADNDKRVPWFYPFKQYHFEKGRGFQLDKVIFMKEVLFLGSALVFHYGSDNE